MTTSSAESISSRFSLTRDQTIGLTTVGIDIGSSTSQLNFSRLELEQVDSKYVVTRRELIFESEIILTPYIDATTIDTVRLEHFIDSQYAEAKMSYDSLDSGAIILTGLALAKHNSRAIADMFSAQAGKFVAVSAGDAMESTLACRGAGVEQISSQTGENIVNIDMGGGTVKYGYVEHGQLIRTAAIDVGARLIVTDADETILRIEESALMMLNHLDLALEIGHQLDHVTSTALTEYMAHEVFAHAGVLSHSRGEKRLLRTAPLFRDDEKPVIDAVTFSGGISEYIYGRESKTFGDLGKGLADAITRHLNEYGLKRREPRMGIRATVLGASQFSLQLSGSTVYASHDSLVPLRNIPVVKPHLNLARDDLDGDEIIETLRAVLQARIPAIHTRAVAIAIVWRGSATYARIDTLAKSLLATAGPDILDTHEVPLIIVCDRDIAGLLGKHIQDLTTQAVSVLTLDGIEVSEFDYLDIGSFVPGTGALPIVVKSLLFPATGG